MCYKLHKTSLDRGVSYIDSPEWFKNKKETINPKNKKDDKYFQYTVTVALNYQQTDNHLEEIYNIKPFINKYDRNGIDSPSHKKDWNKFELNNKTIALNVLFIRYNTKQLFYSFTTKNALKKHESVCKNYDYCYVEMPDKDNII